LQPFTANHQLVIGRSSLFGAQGQTDIYDTLFDGLLMVRQGRYAHKALFMLTDGFDNARKRKKVEAMKDARQLNVAIYSIGIGSPIQGNISSSWSRDNTDVDMDTLDEFADATGGRPTMSPWFQSAPPLVHAPS
jgi:hypothetical protein